MDMDTHGHTHTWTHPHTDTPIHEQKHTHIWTHPHMRKPTHVQTEFVPKVFFVFQMKRAVLHQTHYVELLLVVDNDRVNKHTASNLVYILRVVF